MTRVDLWTIELTLFRNDEGIRKSEVKSEKGTVEGDATGNGQREVYLYMGRKRVMRTREKERFSSPRVLVLYRTTYVDQPLTPR